MLSRTIWHLTRALHVEADRFICDIDMLPSIPSVITRNGNISTSEYYKVVGSKRGKTVETRFKLCDRKQKRTRSFSVYFCELYKFCRLAIPVSSVDLLQWSIKDAYIPFSFIRNTLTRPLMVHASHKTIHQATFLVVFTNTVRSVCAPIV